MKSNKSLAGITNRLVENILNVLNCTLVSPGGKTWNLQDTCSGASNNVLKIRSVKENADGGWYENNL